MNRLAKLKFIIIAALMGLFAHADSASACASCFGKTDSRLAQGMNWGIYCLLFVVIAMLSLVASFFIYLARKSATNPVPMPSGQLFAANSKA